jgi:shikimate kinase
MTNNQAVRHIILIGFMGAGKTSVGRRIARWEHLSCIDIDYYIERQEQASISEIFRERGEDAFRNLETEFLRTMPGRERTVLSCGGGIVTVAVNRELLRSLGTVVYLRVSAQEVMRRIGGSQTRPLLAGNTSPEQLLAQREPLYEALADFVVNTNDLDLNQVAWETIRRLRVRGEL